jgi:uncharacterized coiled-coil protein SlyX
VTAPLPIDVSGISQQLPDPGHEAIRLAALNAITAVAGMHQALVDTVTAQGAQITDMQAALDALTARVTALEPTPAPVPTPAPTT